MSRSPPSSPANLLDLIHRAGQNAGEVFQREIGIEELTARQFALLLCVSQSEGLTQTELVALTGIDRTTTTVIVQRLVTKGWLQRRRKPGDARANALKLSESGRRLVRAVAPRMQRADNIILSALPKHRRARFLRNLNTIVVELCKKT